MPSRASNAVLTVDSREARDIEISLASDFVGRGALSGFGDGESRWGETFDSVAAPSSPKADDPVFRGAGVQFGPRGILDAPPSRGMTAEEWRGRRHQAFAIFSKNPVKSSVTWATWVAPRPSRPQSSRITSLVPSGTTSTVVMPSWCGTTRLRARSSNIADLVGSTP